MASSPATRAKDAGNAVECFRFYDYCPASRVGVFALASLRSFLMSLVFTIAAALVRQSITNRNVRKRAATKVRLSWPTSARARCPRDSRQDAGATEFGPLDSMLLRAPVTGSLLREFYFGGKNGCRDRTGSRHH